MRRSVLVSLVLALTGALLVPAGASGYELTKFRVWERKTVTYRVVSDGLRSDMRGVVSALRRDAGIRLVRARSGERAGITVLSASSFRGIRLSCSTNGAAGVTGVSVSFGPGGRDARAVVRVGSDCRGISRFIVLAHEVAHGLGLDHEDDVCATMNTALLNGFPQRCRDGATIDWRAKPFREDDLRGLRARFRGLPR